MEKTRRCMMSSIYRVCQRCGATLDPEETCDCDKEREATITPRHYPKGGYHPHHSPPPRNSPRRVGRMAVRSITSTIALFCTAAVVASLLAGVASRRTHAEESGIIVIVVVPTPEPRSTPSPSPVPTLEVIDTPRPELPLYDYPAEDARCLSRGIWSVCPVNPTASTRLAFCEVVQNRVDDQSGAYANSVRYVLLQRGEFLDYRPDCVRSKQNNAVADYAMRSWMHAQLTGDRSYRLTPASGVMCKFYSVLGADYIIVMDRYGAAVFDSGPGPA